MIEHQPSQQRFIMTDAGIDAVLDYVIRGTRINFTHTYVPESLRGRGLAEQLVRAGLAWAREHDYQIEASCWYVGKFLKREEEDEQDD
ncbi:GNAT family N-acetyltransferase [Nitrincola sp. A-D6]|uniref:GNAT family N-acetyltransferase n=1 Tax=Nitrincola sp. A-D6 TaxID=1545442 RepID=UPI001F16D7A1|nr:GNAT family N-acetyltransferase [Nitrincola sp. A-D6]